MLAFFDFVPSLWVQTQLVLCTIVYSFMIINYYIQQAYILIEVYIIAVNFNQPVVHLASDEGIYD